MTLLPIPSEFPYIWGKFFFCFISVVWKKVSASQIQVSENEGYGSISYVSKTLELIQPTQFLFSVEIFSVVGEIRLQTKVFLTQKFYKFPVEIFLFFIYKKPFLCGYRETWPESSLS